MTCAGLLHIRHVHARRSFPGIAFLAKTRNDGGRAFCVVDTSAACHCNGEQCERGSVAGPHARDLSVMSGAIPQASFGRMTPVPKMAAVLPLADGLL